MYETRFVCSVGVCACSVRTNTSVRLGKAISVPERVRDDVVRPVFRRELRELEQSSTNEHLRRK